MNKCGLDADGAFDERSGELGISEREPPPQPLTTEELAKRMRVNPSTVRRWRLDDVGPSLSPRRHGMSLPDKRS